MKKDLTPRQIKSHFETIINDNNNAIGKLRTTAQTTRIEKSSLAQKYEACEEQFIANLMTPLTEERLADVGHGALNAYRKAVDEKHSASLQLAQFTKTRGSLTEMEQELDTLRQSQANLHNLLEAREVEAKAIGIEIAGLTFFNAWCIKKGKAPLTESSKDYFHSKKGFSGVMARLFDSHYRRGRAVLKTYSSIGVSPFERQALFEQMKADLSRQRKEYTDKDGYRQSIEKALDKYKPIAALASSTTGASEAVRKNLKAALADKAVFSDLTKRFADDVPAYLVESRAKYEVLTKLTDTTEARLKAMEKANKPLTDSLPKLNKGLSSSRTVRIDIDDIEAQMKKARDGALATADKTSKSAEKVSTFDRRFTPANDAGPSFFDIYLQYLIMDSILDAALPSFDGLGDAFNNAAGTIDTSLPGMPDMNDVLDASQFDLSLPSMDTFEMPDIPDIDIPDIDIPDIDIPDIDVGSFDAGGFDGGFD